MSDLVIGNYITCICFLVIIIAFLFSASTFCEKTFEIQTYLKEYVTDPWFLQLSQDLTIGSLLIHLFCKSFDYQNW